MKKLVQFFILIFLFTSCGPEIKQFISQESESLPEDDPVIVLTTQESVPEEASRIGGIFYPQPDEKKTDFYTQLAFIEKKAKSLGANMVKVNEVSTQLGNAFELKADLYFSDDINYLKEKDKRFGTSPEASSFYFYTQPGESLPEDSFSISINGVPTEIPSNEVFVFENRSNSIHIELEDEEIEFNPQNGLAYYIRINTTKSKSKPTFELVNPLQARLAIEALYGKEDKINTIVYDKELKSSLNDEEVVKSYPDIKPKQLREIHKMSFFVAAGFAEKTEGYINNRREELNRIQDDLSTSIFINLGASYYFDKYNGIGINYQYFNASTTTELSRPFPSGNLQFEGRYEVDRTINYFGLNYHRRFFIGRRDELILSAGPGYFFYSAINKDATTTNKPSTSDFAANIELSYNVFLFNDFYLHLTAGLLIGTTNEIRSSYVDDDRFDTSLKLDPTLYHKGRAYFGIGLKYNL
ncbi:MAG: hypothetical protein LAT51_06295 [Flavobacteriaceae bacterium]|nr:hypothetical protein [Flavobacteriaceae bacterium]